MRVKETIEKSGYFWLLSNPGRKIPGKFTISDGGKIELEVLGLFDDSIEAINNITNGKIALERIIGHVEKYGFVTFDDCFYQNRTISINSGGEIFKADIHVSQAFLGVAYEEKEVVLFNKFRFSVEGIDEWVEITGIKVDNQCENRTSTITFEEPEEIAMVLNISMKLLITFSSNLKLSPKPTEAKITQKIYFELVSEEEKPLNDFIEIARKLAIFLSFAMDENVNIELVSAISNSIVHQFENDKTLPARISVYYPSQPFTEQIPKINKHQMLFRYTQIREHAERIINNWLDAYDLIAPAMNLYFSTKIGAQKYLDGKFLALVQCLETYHRRTSDEKLMDESKYRELVKTISDQCPEENKKWLLGRLNKGNELSLSQRIKAVIKPFKEQIGTSKEREKLINNISETRNYLTHYDEDLETKVSINGSDLFMLCLKMEVIFQLHLLRILGFSNEEINSIAKNCRQLQHKLNYKNL